MFLETRKYNLIQRLFNFHSEEIVSALELVLEKHKEEGNTISLSHKKLLDDRLQTYIDNPKNILDWNDVKNHWYVIQD